MHLLILNSHRRSATKVMCSADKSWRLAGGVRGGSGDAGPMSRDEHLAKLVTINTTSRSHTVLPSTVGTIITIKSRPLNRRIHTPPPSS